MRIPRVIISFFLLIVYSTVLVHDIIPHCSFVSASETSVISANSGFHTHNDDHHHGHHHTPSETPDLKSPTTDGELLHTLSHLLLDGMHHDASGQHHMDYVASNNKITQTNLNSDFSYLFSFTLPAVYSKIIVANNPVIPHRLSPRQSCSQLLRGPPVTG